VWLERNFSRSLLGSSAPRIIATHHQGIREAHSCVLLLGVRGHQWCRALCALELLLVVPLC
jgi:hypothetical protein